MALKPTIYKFTIDLSDLDRNIYEQLNLTVAQHPSESVERMMARVIAYCLNMGPELTFTRGVSATDEPDIWQHELNGQISLWIDIGEPTFERIKKATRQADAVKVYSINQKSDIWWQQIEQDLLPFKLEIHQFQWQELQAVAAHATRTMSFSLSITEQTCYLTTDSDSLTVSSKALKTSL